MEQPSWSATVAATLDRPVPQQEAHALGRAVAGDTTGTLVVVAVHDSRFAVTTRHQARPEPAAVMAAYERQLVDAGYRLVTWEAVELLSTDEVDRRLAAAAAPPLMSAAELAEACGVSTQRIYELETARKKAEAEGQEHSFPRPVVPGWWLRAVGERYAATRKRRPGPTPRG